MRKFLSLLFLSSPLLFVPIAPAQDTTKQSRAADSALSGRWIVSAEFYGSPLYFMMELEQNGDKLIGNFDGDKLEGTITGNSIQVLAKDDQGGTVEAKGTLENGTITGTVVFVNRDDKSHPTSHQFTATIVPKRRAGAAAQRHEFVPTIFYRRFSAENKPVLS